MQIEDLIRDKFNDLARYEQSGELLFSPEYARQVIDYIEQLHGVILGLNFWRIEEQNITEVNSTEWSTINQGEQASEKTISEARSLIANGLLDKAECVSFVLEDKEVPTK